MTTALQRAQKDMRPEEFEACRKMIFQEAGIVLKEHKMQMVQTRLGKRLVATGIGSFAEYLDRVASPDGEDEKIHFINALTTNLTSFFREAHHFEHLTTSFLPEAAAQGGVIRIWSAGCSTGQEPVSIGLAVRKFGARRTMPPVKVLATDIDTDILRRAEAGEYDRERASDALEYWKEGFEPSPKNGHVRTAKSIRELITYLPLNLQREWPMRKKFAAVFCRNVLIYFEPEQKKALVERFIDQVQPGGMLYLGHSEALIGSHPRLRAEAHTAYRRIA